MPEPQTPAEAPTGTTSTDVPAAQPQKPRRKPGRPKKVHPPAINVTIDTAEPEMEAVWVDAQPTIEKDLQELRDRVAALEAKNRADEVTQAKDEEAARLAKLTNLERAQERSRRRKAAQKALASK